VNKIPVANKAPAQTDNDFVNKVIISYFRLKISIA
jgi:hypothetical protein